jgi:hypothetical protein
MMGIVCLGDRDIVLMTSNTNEEIWSVSWMKKTLQMIAVPWKRSMATEVRKRGS